MDCRECESQLIALAVGELSEEAASQCRAHLDACPECREALAEYAGLIHAIADEPEVVPSVSESAELAAALERVQVRRAEAPKVSAPRPQGFFAFALASVVAFVLVAAALSLQVRGMIDIMAVITGRGALAAVLALTVVVFVTSFVPIAVTARRRPLNGMTFRR
jgi:anti-sigma factor RsiW